MDMLGADGDSDSEEGKGNGDLPSEDEDGLDLRRESFPMKGHRLWNSSAMYPNGVANPYHLPNIMAAFTYDCPCSRKCLSRVQAYHGHEAGHVLCTHRQGIRARAKELGRGGLRDHTASVYASHFNKVVGAFTRSFVVGGVGDVCERAFAIATGLSEVTYARARRDAIADRPKHAARIVHRQQRESTDRVELDAWVRRLRGTLEGNKNGAGGKWYMRKTTEGQLWKMYQSECDAARQLSGLCGGTEG